MLKLEVGGGEQTSSRQNMAIGLERSNLTKACSVMWDWMIFVNPFPDPIALTEEVRRCWNNSRRELDFPNFAESTLVSNDQTQSKDSACRSQYLHTVKKTITELYKLKIDDPMAYKCRAKYLLEEDRLPYPLRNYEIRTILKKRIKKEWGKRVERKEGYSNNEDGTSQMQREGMVATYHNGIKGEIWEYQIM
ncbi:hypothetical protein B9Z19DRAFT_1131419 [Tuber borchii]|uniref:Uncharacterized protein n=1 Tax=Tuber borchii TaxID=42251 RepID=A0A2T6ZIU7_TUBBO|nr:hypothetical protein B9Z19DRAFT_1131419 [Tuber borchii]